MKKTSAKAAKEEEEEEEEEEDAAPPVALTAGTVMSVNASSGSAFVVAVDKRVPNGHDYSVLVEVSCCGGPGDRYRAKDQGEERREREGGPVGNMHVCAGRSVA